jgi:hypothetical protein
MNTRPSLLRRALFPWALVTTLLLPLGTLEAQTIGIGFGNRTRVAPGQGLPDIPGGFTFCRLWWNSVRDFSSGSGWNTDFPQADRNMSIRITELTPVTNSLWTHGEPGFAIVRATEPELFQCPFLFASHVGEMGLSPSEVERLREYLLKGGLLWADDFWGTPSWRAFAGEVARILPEYEIVELPMDHPLFSIVYNVPSIPQIPSINHWRRTGGGTSELGFDSEQQSMSAVMNEEGRILILITHNTDIADGWEREAEDPNFFYLFSPDAYAIGVNIVIWSMTH